MGLRKNFSYDEVLRAIGQQPLDLPVPNRVGLKTYEDIFFSNLINHQSSYLGDVKKTGFSHEAPYEPPQRSEVYYDARSDAGADPPYASDGGGGPPPPPPPGTFQGLFGTRTGNMPIQSGYYATPFNQNTIHMPAYPNAPYNILAEEGMYPDLEPPQPGLLRRIGQNIADSAREGAINQAGQMGAALGASAVTLAGGRSEEREALSAMERHNMARTSWIFTGEAACREDPS